MKRALAVLALLLVATLVGLGVLVWLEGPRLLEAGIRYSAGILGYQDVEVEVAEVGLASAKLARFSAGPAPGIAASDVSLAYTWRQLATARVGSVEVGSATLHGVRGEDGIRFPAVPPAEEGPWIAPPAFDRLRVTKARIEITGEEGPISVSIRDVDLGAPPGARIRARGHASVAREAGGLSADVDVVIDGDRVNGHARITADDGSLDLRADLGAPGPEPGRFPDLAGPEELKLRGRIEITAEDADLSPLTPSLTANGAIDLRMEGGRLTIRSESLDLTGFGIDLSGLGVDLDLAGLAPPVAPPGQRVSVRTARIGMEIGGGALQFGLDRDGVVSIQSLDWSFHGGQLTTEGRYDPGAEANELVLGIAAVDLSSLVGALERPDLSITGIVDGELPLRIEGDRIFADGGRLMASEAGGVIRYQPGGPSEAPAEQPESGAVGGIDLVMDALENFQYRKLRIEVDGELTGEMVLRIQLEGSNPDVYDGYPFQVNLNLEGPLADVVEGGTTGFRIQDALEKRFQERGEGR